MCWSINNDSLTAWGAFIGGIGTAGAFLIAALAFLVKARNDRSAQARLVHGGMARPASTFDFQEAGPRVMGVAGYAGTQLENSLVSFSLEGDLSIEDDATLIWPSVPNRSQEFIFDVSLVVFGDGQEWARFTAATVPPGGEAEFLAVLSPEHRPDVTFSFEVRFTDAVGRRWLNRSGRATRLTWWRRP